MSGSMIAIPSWETNEIAASTPSGPRRPAIRSLTRGRYLARRLLRGEPVTDVVGYICVRADHQWESVDAAGEMHPVNGSLGYCPDAAARGEMHLWHACGIDPRADMAALAAR